MNDHYETSDMKIASVLYNQGHKLIKHNLTTDIRPRIVFFFEGEEIFDTINNYLAGKLCLEPRKLFDSQNVIKNIIHAYNNYGQN